MTKKTATVISWIFVILSFLLIGFGCFAPCLFIKESNKYDFTQTGQIGDTIGGTMGPIIAIAGVCMTFIAFLMQVRANEIQREQLKKSLNIKLLENKIESRNALELLNIDIKTMLSSIEATCNNISKFCKDTEARPTGDFPLLFTPEYSHERYKSINRNLLFSAFKNFMNSSDTDNSFASIYNKLDFYSEGLHLLKHNVYEPYIDEIMQIKYSIPESYKKLIEALYNIPNQPAAIGILISQFKKELSPLIDSDGILDVFGLYKLLNDSKYNAVYSYIPQEHIFLVSKTNALISKNLLLVAELRKTVDKFKKNEIYDWLQKMNEQIETALNTHTIESIQDEFKNNI